MAVTNYVGQKRRIDMAGPDGATTSPIYNVTHQTGIETGTPLLPQDSMCTLVYAGRPKFGIPVIQTVPAVEMDERTSQIEFTGFKIAEE